VRMVHWGARRGLCVGHESHASAGRGICTAAWHKTCKPTVGGRTRRATRCALDVRSCWLAIARFHHFMCPCLSRVVSGVAAYRVSRARGGSHCLRLTFGVRLFYVTRSVPRTQVRTCEWECRRELARVVPRRRCAAGPCVRACPASRTVYPRDVRYAKGAYAAVRLRAALAFRGVAMPRSSHGQGDPVNVDSDFL
jgi:hypothetical protein